MLDGFAPLPSDYDPGPPSLFVCVVIVLIAVMLVGLLIPRPLFDRMFKIAFPFMPHKLE
jgi:hypothetical protein